MAIVTNGGKRIKGTCALNTLNKAFKACADPEVGTGVQTPLKNLKFIGFPSNTVELSVKRPLSKRSKIGFQENYRLRQVKNSILQ